MINADTTTPVFDIQGHRGARGLAPENTLVSFARALSIGVATLELDIAISSDGVAVVTHNPRLDPMITRGPDGAWLDVDGPPVYSLSAEQLKSFDVGRIKPGTDYASLYPEQVSHDGAKIPTLDDVLELVKKSGNDVVRLNIEVKIRPMEPDIFPVPAVIVAIILDTIAKHNFTDRVIIQAFDWRILREVQRLAPEVPTSYLTVRQSWYDNIHGGNAGPSPWTDGYDIDDYNGDLPQMIKKAGGKMWSSFHQEIDAGKIARSHDLGLKVMAWTVNEPTRMGELIDLGIDAIITDYPDRLQAVLKKRGIAAPGPTPVAP